MSARHMALLRESTCAARNGSVAQRPYHRPMRGIRLALAIVFGFVLAWSAPSLSGDEHSPSPTVDEQASCLASPEPSAASEATASPIGPCTNGPTLEQMVGQKLVVTMAGHKLGKALAGRIRRGEIGGIVLLGRNIASPSALKRLTRRLQLAAAEGEQPPLLISVDQEGRSVKRIPWAPPTMTAPEMGHLGSIRIARMQGARTGAALRRLGVNVDLAPVADLPRSSGSFMYQQGRTFSFDGKRTARLADAFATGLMSRGVLPTMKHFPGIGLAIRNTDRYVSTIRTSRAALRRDLRPYRRAIRHDIPLIMLSNATFTAYDSGDAAGWSAAIASGLLRTELGFEGATITDSLNGTAHARGMKVKTLATRAARAGTDLILMTGSERSSARLYTALVERAERGSIPPATLRASHDRILVLKERLRSE